MPFSSDTQTAYYDQTFKGVVCQNEEILSKEFDNCVFIKCSFTETTFQDCRFLDCTFKECDLSLMHIKGCSFTNTKFKDSKLIGVNWTEASWPKKGLLQAIGFTDCAISHSTFIGLSLKNIELIRCIAKDVDFAEADLTLADCTYTDFMDSRFLRTNLTEADFTHARNYSIAADLNVLKKTKFSLPEAMALLDSLDIVIDDLKE